MTNEQARLVVDEIFALYGEYGQSDYIGEPVSQLEHMCQAALLAENEGYDDEVVMAAFFHDIGHLCEFIMPVEHMEGVGVMDHESIGQQYLLDKGFSPRLGKLVRSHVEAKRYLTYKYPEYFEKLSEASRITLSHQGGVMTEAEAVDFETDPMFDLFIKMRSWDDLAKETNQPIPPLEKFKEKAFQLLTQ